MQKSMDKAIQEKIQFKIHSDEKRDKLNILSEENKSLRIKLQDFDDDNKKFKKQLKQLQLTIETHQDNSHLIQKLQNDLQFSNNLLKLKDSDHEESKKSISNL